MWDTVGSELMIKAVEGAVKKFFDWRSNRNRNSQLVSISLAVGYYYNFIDPLFASFEGDKSRLYSMVRDTDPPQFRSKGEIKLADVRMQIIIPTRLDDNLFARCEDDFSACKKGFFYSPPHKRYLGVNYSVRKVGDRRETTIIDLARTVMAVKRYYEDFGKLDTRKETDRWSKIQAAELAAFKESLRWFLSHGSSKWANKLDFKEPA
jgi:hypothetical protein